LRARRPRSDTRFLVISWIYRNFLQRCFAFRKQPELRQHSILIKEFYNGPQRRSSQS
jgi:hypothetical protein